MKSTTGFTIVQWYHEVKRLEALPKNEEVADKLKDAKFQFESDKLKLEERMRICGEVQSEACDEMNRQDIIYDTVSSEYLRIEEILEGVS